MGTARRHLSSIIESEGTNVYSLEMSMLGYKLDRKSDKIHPYTEDHCRDMITITAAVRCSVCRHPAGPQHLQGAVRLLQDQRTHRDSHRPRGGGAGDSDN